MKCCRGWESAEQLQQKCCHMACGLTDSHLSVKCVRLQGSSHLQAETAVASAGKWNKTSRLVSVHVTKSALADWLLVDFRLLNSIDCVNNESASYSYIMGRGQGTNRDWVCSFIHLCKPFWLIFVQFSICFLTFLIIVSLQKKKMLQIHYLLADHK